MAKSKFPVIRSIFIFILAIAATWAMQRWANSADNIPAGNILINGQKVTIIDGDSFKIGGDEYRIYGIDAPEYRQACYAADNAQWPCGKVARTGLETLMRGKKFSCDLLTRDKFARAIVQCVDEKNQDLGAKMVVAGLAVSGDNFDDVIYGKEEASAEKASRGIWQGRFKKPANWRAAHSR